MRVNMSIEKAETIYMCHILVFDRGDTIIKYFNRATHNYWPWQLIPVRYRKKLEDRKKIFDFVDSYKEGKLKTRNACVFCLFV